MLTVGLRSISFMFSLTCWNTKIVCQRKANVNNTRRNGTLDRSSSFSRQQGYPEYHSLDACQSAIQCYQVRRGTRWDEYLGYHPRATIARVLASLKNMLIHSGFRRVYLLNRLYHWGENILWSELFFLIVYSWLSHKNWFCSLFQWRPCAISSVQVTPHKLPWKHLQRLGPFPSLIGQLISAMHQQDAPWKFTLVSWFNSLAGNYLSLCKASY